MYLEHIALENYRTFQAAEIDLHPQLNVFFGINNVGKTNLLAGICTGVSRYFSATNIREEYPSFKLTHPTIAEGDMRNWSKTMPNGRLVKQHSEQTSLEVSIKLSDYTAYAWQVLRWRDTKERAKFFKDIQKSHIESKLGASHTAVGFRLNRSPEDFAKTLLMREDGSQQIPTLAYYGPHRGAAQGNRKRFGRKKIDFSDPFSAYVRALEPVLDFDLFLDWFSEEESSELRQIRENSSYRSITLSAVREALKRLLSGNEFQYENLRFISDPKRFVINKMHKGEPTDIVEFDKLSDGFRSMIALVADYARRMGLANQYAELDNPLDGEGILIIDEIDVHLHPRWQSTVLAGLRRCFPNVQIIATTHAPMVLAGIEEGSAFELSYDEECGSQVSHIIEKLIGYSVKDILPEFMGTAPIIDSKFQDQIKAYERAIEEGAHDTLNWKEKKAILIEVFGENHPIIQNLESKENTFAIRQNIKKFYQDKK